jgi:antitoxin CptB
MEPKLEIVARRARYRAWHRGTKEMDLLLGGFADEMTPRFDAVQLALFEQILEEADRDLYDWVTGKTPPPAHVDAGLIAAIARRAGA